MADPLSIAAGVIAVITATIQSSTALYDTIESFKNYPQRVHELSKQLLSLTKILISLRELSEQDESVGAPLKVPLAECGAACARFREILELHRRSLSSGKSFQAWVSFRFRNGDIVNFMETLAVYKSTMAIAIADANLRTSKVTLSVLNEYKREVDETTEHLQQHFEDVLVRLDSLRTPNVDEQRQSQRISEYHEQMGEESNRVEHCLKICRRFQADIDQARYQLLQSHAPASTINSPAYAATTKDMTLADMTTLSCLKTCGLELGHAINRLGKQGTTAQSRLLEETSPSVQWQEQFRDEGYTGAGNQEQVYDRENGTQGMEGELASVRHLLDFCKDASSRATPDRVHVVEDITVGDVAQQICVSTVGDLFKIKRAKAGDGSLQLFGSFAPEQLREITTLHANNGQHTFVANETEGSEPKEELYSHTNAGGASRAN